MRQRSLILFHALTRHAIDDRVASRIHEPHAQSDSENDQREEDRREGDDDKRDVEVRPIVVSQVKHSLKQRQR